MVYLDVIMTTSLYISDIEYVIDNQIASFSSCKQFENFFYPSKSVPPRIKISVFKNSANGVFDCRYCDIKTVENVKTGDGEYERATLYEDFEHYRVFVAFSQVQYSMLLAFKVLTQLVSDSLVYFSGFVIHASAVVFERKGIMFVGSSGIGKSTQANLWHDIAKAQILNHDRPVIRCLDSIPFIFGTIWNGKGDGVSANEGYPIRALIFLDKADENRIFKLSVSDSLQLLFDNSCVHDISESLKTKFYYTTLMVVDAVPCYRYACRDDPSAVVFLNNFLGRKELCV